MLYATVVKGDARSSNKAQALTRRYVSSCDCCTPAEAASHFIAESGISETFYIYDLGEVARLHNTWTAAMPRVTPHYAGAGLLCRCRVICHLVCFFSSRGQHC
jgi:hypothetical protein